MIAPRQQRVEYLAGLLDASDPGQRIDTPERTGDESGFGGRPKSSGAS